MRKFADKQTIRQRTKNRQTDVSTTESTLILSGSSPDTRGSWPIVGKDGQVNYWWDTDNNRLVE